MCSALLLTVCSVSSNTDYLLICSDGEISTRRIKLWGQSFNDLLADEQGISKFQQFLDREYSGENLRFWKEVQRLRTCAVRMVPVLVTEIYKYALFDLVVT